MSWEISAEEAEAVEERQFDNVLLPLSEYHVVIEDAVEDVSAAGNDMAVLTLTVMEGEYEGTKMWVRIVAPGQDVDIIWKWKQLWAALGRDTSQGIDINLDELLGLDLFVRVGHQNYEGEKRHFVKSYVPLVSEDSGPQVPKGSKSPAPKKGKSAGKGLPLPK